MANNSRSHILKDYGIVSSECAVHRDVNPIESNDSLMILFMILLVLEEVLEEDLKTS